MSSDGDSGFLNQVVDTAANFTTQVFTGGLVGYENGKMTKGVITRGVDESLGEITGRNAARDAMAQNQQALSDSKLAAEEERQNEITRRRDQDVLASRAAAISKRRGSLGLGADNATQDVLGV